VHHYTNNFPLQTVIAELAGIAPHARIARDEQCRLMPFGKKVQA